MSVEKQCIAAAGWFPPAALTVRTLVLPLDRDGVPSCAPPATDEVHLWQVPLAVPATRLTKLQQTLAPDERERAARLRFPQDRAWFVAARGRLRQVLGGYLDRDPAQVSFRYDCACGRRECPPAHQKPALAAHDLIPSLQFNVSHSAGHALIAVTRGRAVGVDLEVLTKSDDLAPLLSVAFSPRDQALVQSLPTDERRSVAYRCWTAKEAYLKARGLGLSLGPDRVELALDIAGTPLLRAVAGDYREARRWALWSLTPCPDYVGALVVALTPLRTATPASPLTSAPLLANG